ERIRFVEKQQCLAVFRLAKDCAQILFGFSNVLADHAGKIDLEELQCEFPCQDLCCHRFPCAGRSGEQHVESLPSRKFGAESPLRMDDSAKGEPRGDMPELRQFVGRKDQIGPGIPRFDAKGIPSYMGCGEDSSSSKKLLGRG